MSKLYYIYPKSVCGYVKSYHNGVLELTPDRKQAYKTRFLFIAQWKAFLMNIYGYNVGVRGF